MSANACSEFAGDTVDGGLCRGGQGKLLGFNAGYGVFGVYNVIMQRVIVLSMRCCRLFVL